jgi:hypothetical protein
MFTLREASRTPDQLEAAKRDLNEAYRQYKTVSAIMADPEFVQKSAILVRQIAADVWKGTDPTPLFFDPMTGPGLGNWLEIKDFINTARVVKRSLGGKPTTFTPHARKYAIELEDFRVDFALELEAVLTGQMDPSVIADFMGDAIGRHYIRAGLGAIDAACQVGVLDQYGQPTRTELGTIIDDVTLDAALAQLGDANPDVIIAGRYSALFPILGFSGYSDAALEEIRQTGATGRYKGAQVVVLRDSYNPFFREAAVPSDRIYMVGGERGGVFVEEDMSFLDYSTIDPEELHQRIGTKLRSTFFVSKPWRYHVIEV